MPTQPLSRLVRRLRTALDADALAAAPDADLLAHFRRHRDPAAFEALVRRHGPRVLAACRRVLADPADIDDACQAAFLVLMRDPTAVRDGRALGGWLAGVAHRVSLKALARRRRRGQVEARAKPRPTTSPDLSWREACAILHEELDRLPDRQRLPLILCYLDGLSRDEAASRLGRSVNTVKKVLEAGRARLRQRLVRRGVTLSAGLLAAAAAPVGGGPATELMAPGVGGTVRPAVAELARAVHAGSWLRAVGVGLAAVVLAVGVGLGFQGGPKPGPVAGKDPPPKEAPRGERIAISGTVVDADGKPVKGATLSLAGWEADPRKAADPKTLGTSGDGGRFAFDLPPDQLARFPQPHLVAVAKDHGLALHRLTAAGAKDVTVKLPPDAPLTGTLFDRQKQPAADARVRVVAVWLPDKDDMDMAIRLVAKADWGTLSGTAPTEPLTRRVRLGTESLAGLPAEVRTDAKGRFVVKGLGADRFARLVIDRPGMVTAEIVVFARAGKDAARPILVPGVSKPGVVTLHESPAYYVVTASRGFYGRVVDRESGDPVKDVAVRAPDGPAYPWAATDRDGWYNVDSLAQPPRRLTVEPPSDSRYFPLTLPVDGWHGKDDPVRLDLRLTRGVWLTGRVVEARSNKPLAGARVVYHPHRTNGSPSAILVWKQPGREDRVESVHSEVRTGEDGRFRLLAARGRGWLLADGPFNGLPADRRDIQGDVADRTPPPELPVGLRKSESPFSYKAVAAVNVDSDQAASVTITLEPGVRPEVRFVDPDGKPLAGVLTRDRRLVPDGPPMPLPEKVPSIELSNPERPAPLVVFHPATGLGAAYLPRKGDAGPWTVTLKPTATVTARLVRRDGKPIANEPVYIHADEGGVPLSPSPMEVRTDQDGRLRITGVIGDADYSLWCVELGAGLKGNRSRSFTARPGEAKDLGELKAGP